MNGIELLKDKNAKQIYENSLDILGRIENNNFSTYANSIKKEQIEIYLKTISVIVDKMLDTKYNVDDEYEEISKNYTTKSLIKISELIKDSYKKLTTNTNEQGIIDSLLIGILEAKI